MSVRKSKEKSCFSLFGVRIEVDLCVLKGKQSFVRRHWSTFELTDRVVKQTDCVAKFVRLQFWNESAKPHTTQHTLLPSKHQQSNSKMKVKLNVWFSCTIVFTFFVICLASFELNQIRSNYYYLHVSQFKRDFFI